MAHDFILASSEYIQSVGLRYMYRIRSESSPLAVLIHGRAGEVGTKIVFRRAFPEDYNIISFEAPISDPIGGYSWWNVESPDIKKDATQAAQNLWQCLFRAIEVHNLDPRFLCLSGFSQGAALCSVLLQFYPQYIHKAALLAGFTLKVSELPGTQEGIETRVLVVHGHDDEVVPLDVAKEGANYLNALGFNVDFFSEEGVGHKVGRKGMRYLKDFFLDSDL